MKLDTAKLLNQHVNKEFFEDAINTFVVERVGELHAELETARSLEDVKYIQGAIAELRRLQNLRRDVNAVLALHRK